MKEDFIFWRLAYFFIKEQGYRIIQLFDNQREIWLEKLEYKHAPIIRILHQDFDWSNTMQRDIEFAAANAERVRRQIHKTKLNVFNIYVSQYPPVDEYEFRLQKPYINQEGQKTTLTSILMANGEFQSTLKKLSGMLNSEIDFPIDESYSEEMIEQVKNTALELADRRVKAEKKVFMSGKPFITYVLMAIQILVYFFLELNGGSTNNSTLIKYGAKVNYLIVEGEWWRFLTPVFLHIGFLHLAMNTLALYYLGTVVERMFGNVRFLFIYLFAGITGVIASFIVNPVLSAGASGAIFGCFGALLYFGVIYPKLFFRTIGINILVVLGLNFVIDFSVSGIDNAGHIGGLAGGFLAAGMVHFPKKKKLWQQFLFFIISIAIVGGTLFYGFKAQSSGMDEQSTILLAQKYFNQNDYSKAYQLLSQYEKKSKHPSKRIYLILGYTEYKKEMYLEAQVNLNQAIKLDPNLSEAYYYLALIDFNENDLSHAKLNTEKALKLRPDDKDYLWLVQEINRYLGSS
jgi:rhomboid protease GluP